MLKRIVLIFTFFSFSLFAIDAEPSHPTQGRKLRFFALDLHSSVTADAVDIFKNLGHDLEFWTISHLSRPVFGKPQDSLEVIDYNVAEGHLTIEKCYEFYERYKDQLSQYDAFIVTGLYFPFSFIFEKLNKPVIIINAVRYEIPFTNKEDQRRRLDEHLINQTRSNKMFIVSNNKADQIYLKYYTGIDSDLIPALCNYTHAEYTGIREHFVLQASRMPRLNFLATEMLPKLVKMVTPPYSWQDYYAYKGIVHFPYQVSTMSLFEQYSANVPLFFPTKKFLKRLYQEDPNQVLREVSLYFYYKMSPCTIPGDLNNLSDQNVLNFWIDNADFYDEENMPHIQYFESYKHLFHLLRDADLKEISAKMKEHNVKRKEMVYRKWEQVLEKVAAACESN